MARPTHADAAQTRQRILEAAQRLFAEQGRRASVRSLAQAAGVSLATIHHYFGSKEGLYQACIEVMDDAYVELSRSLLATVAEGGSLASILESVVRQAYAFCLEYGVAVRLSTRNAIDAGELEPLRRSRLMLPGLEEGSALLSAMLGASPRELRLVIRSLAFLIVRYALTLPRELALLLGEDPEEVDEAACHQAIEEHLVFTAQTLFSALRGESHE